MSVSSKFGLLLLEISNDFYPSLCFNIKDNYIICCLILVVFFSISVDTQREISSASKIIDADWKRKRGTNSTNIKAISGRKNTNNDSNDDDKKLHISTSSSSSFLLALALQCFNHKTEKFPPSDLVLPRKCDEFSVNQTNKNEVGKFYSK